MGKLRLIETYKAHDGIAWSVAWSPNGNYLASCGEDKVINIWEENFAWWEKKTKLTIGHSSTIREINWSPCGNYIASASFDGTIGIWDKKSGKWECNASLEGHESEVKSVAWANSGQLLATCSRDKSVWVWEIADEDEYECAAVLNAHTQDVKKVKWHPSQDILASVSYDNTIKLFKEDPSDHDWMCMSTLTSHKSTVWSLAFDHSGSRFASVSDDKTLKIWKEYKPDNKENVSTPDGESVWKNICTLSGYHNRTIYDVSWCHINDLIVTACGDDAIRIFKDFNVNLNVDEPTFELISSNEKAHSQDVNSVAWNPVIPGLLASCSDDGSGPFSLIKKRENNLVVHQTVRMNSQSNCYENLINSFRTVCSALEKKAEFDLKQLEKECEDDFASNVESLQKFNKIISGISETCTEIVNNYDILKNAVITNINENAINLPYEMHADLVQCIKELYDMHPLEKDSYEEKFFSERNKQLITDLLKVGEKNIHDVKDIENTITEAKEIF